MSKKVAIIQGNISYTNLFARMGFEIAPTVADADIVCFTGGEDVTPALYGDAAHPATWNNPHRDEKERAIFDQCVFSDIPMIGICRGGQFLNVMNGGRMYQHVEKHACHAGHMMTVIETGEEVFVSSTHHQMMMPGEDAVLLAYAKLGGQREWYDGHVEKRDISNTDYEVLAYKSTNSICFQPHPEFNGAEYAGMHAYFQSLVNSLVA